MKAQGFLGCVIRCLRQEICSIITDQRWTLSTNDGGGRGVGQEVPVGSWNHPPITSSFFPSIPDPTHWLTVQGCSGSTLARLIPLEFTEREGEGSNDSLLLGLSPLHLCQKLNIFDGTKQSLWLLSSDETIGSKHICWPLLGKFFALKPHVSGSIIVCACMRVCVRACWYRGDQLALTLG